MMRTHLMSKTNPRLVRFHCDRLQLEASKPIGLGTSMTTVGPDGGLWLAGGEAVGRLSCGAGGSAGEAGWLDGTPAAGPLSLGWFLIADTASSNVQKCICRTTTIAAERIRAVAPIAAHFSSLFRFRLQGRLILSVLSASAGIA
jgi:hypothetical protein